MTRRHRSLSRGAVVALLLLTALVHKGNAQGGRASDNILYPQPPLPLFIGIEGGYSWWSHDAAFTVGDGARRCAEFLDGEGDGAAFGARSFIYLTPWVVVSPRLRYEQRPGTFLAELGTEPVRDHRDSVVTLQRDAQVDARWSALILDLRIGVDLFSTGIYVTVGPTAALMMGGTYDYRERIASPSGFEFSETHSSEAVLGANRTFDLYEQFAFDVRGGLGYLLEFGRIALNPEIYYTYPLTSALAAPERLKQASYGGSFGVMYNLGEVR